jgi:ribonuclease G
MKGREILIEDLPQGGTGAALRIDGRLEDLILDPADHDGTPRPEAIYLGRVGKPMKGIGGAFVELGGTATGFLRGQRVPPAGRAVLVQVSAAADPGKAPPVSDRVLLKGRAAIVTPGAPGCNVAKSIQDDRRRELLAAVARSALAGMPDAPGIIVRSAAAAMPDTAIADELAQLLERWAMLRERAQEAKPGLLAPAPSAADIARREWMSPPTSLAHAPGSFEANGVWESVCRLLAPACPLGSTASMFIEPTKALVAVDVNTGNEQSPAAALKANLAAAGALPRELRLRGLGGQITIDFAPLAKADRRKIEAALAGALKRDGIDTTIAGWTNLGHLELHRKRARIPLSDLRDQIAGL